MVKSLQKAVREPGRSVSSVPEHSNLTRCFISRTPIPAAQGWAGLHKGNYQQGRCRISGEITFTGATWVPLPIALITLMTALAEPSWLRSHQRTPTKAQVLLAWRGFRAGGPKCKDPSPVGTAQHTGTAEPDLRASQENLPLCKALELLNAIPGTLLGPQSHLWLLFPALFQHRKTTTRALCRQ